MNREPLTDADLSSGKDFGKLMQGYKAAKPPFFKTGKFWFGTSAVMVTAVAALLIYTKVIAPDSFSTDGMEQAAFVNPPMPQADIKTTSFIVDADKDTTVVYVSGSKIRVPANAFLDAQGNVVSGKVELQYREFKDAIDVLLAGIPMTYDSAGQQYHFETAGMMQISATQNGKELFTNPNAPINVDMVSNDSRDVFNSYYLDTVKKEWEYIARANYTDKVAAPGTFADGMALGNIKKGQSLFLANCAACHSGIFDGTGPALKGAVARWDATPTFNGKTGREWLYAWVKNYNIGMESGHPYSVAMAESRPSAQNLYPWITDEDIDNIMAFIESADTAYMRDFESEDAHIIVYAQASKGDKTSNEIVALREQFDNVKTEIKAIEAKKPVEPKQIDKAKPRFSIKVDEKEFPEIAIYKGMKFQVVDVSKYDEKKAKIMWDDISMKRIPNSLNYEITFTNTATSYSIAATPVFDTKEYADAKKLYNEKLEAYETALVKKKKEEAELKAALETRAKEVKQAMEKEIAAQEKRQREYEARLSQSNLVYRTFQVNNFGIYNCDQPLMFPVNASVVAKFINKQTKEELSYATIYLVEKGRNVIFTYYGETLTKFRFDPTKQYLIWAVTGDAQVGIMKPAQFSEAVKDKKEVTFALDVLDKKFNSSAEVKAYLEI